MRIIIIIIFSVMQVNSFVYLLGGLPGGRFNVLGSRFMILVVYLSCANLATWPAHLHFSLYQLSAISVTFVISLIVSFRILLRRYIPSIDLSMAPCAILNFSADFLVGVIVSVAYIITGKVY